MSRGDELKEKLNQLFNKQYTIEEKILYNKKKYKELKQLKIQLYELIKSTESISNTLDSFNTSNFLKISNFKENISRPKTPEIATKKIQKEPIKKQTKKSTVSSKEKFTTVSVKKPLHEAKKEQSLIHVQRTPTKINKTISVKSSKKVKPIAFNAQEDAQHISNLKEIKERFKKIYLQKNYPSKINYINSFILFLKSGMLSSNKALTLVFSSNKVIYENTKEIIKKEVTKKISIVDSKIKSFNETVSKYSPSLLCKEFVPSQTAINGLIFVTKEEEKNLLSHKQPIEIINIFKSIYILLNEDTQEIPEEKLIENLFEKVLPKYKVDSLRYLFQNVIAKTIKYETITEKSFEALIALTKKFPKIYIGSDLIRINRSVSYMNFLIKEAYEYISFKLPDGTYLFKLKQMEKENKKNEIIKKNLVQCLSLYS